MSAPDRAPELSLIVPCYNEEELVGYTIPELAKAFAQAEHVIEIIAVDNGSSDRTGEILDELIARGLPMRKVRVDVNEGYGHGVLSAVPHCRGRWISSIPADGQVDATDVARLFDVIKNSRVPVLGKVRRRFRMDGLARTLITIAYNAFVFLLWPRLGSADVNGSPKMVPAHLLRAMDLKSKDWFIDPEIMLKAHYLGIGILEMNVFSRMRSAGYSHVRLGTCWDFVAKLLRARFGGELRAWRRQVGQVPAPAPAEREESEAERIG